MKKVMVLGLILLLALAGCSRKTVAPVAEPVHDTLYRNSVQYDTAFVDRWHTITLKGDTVHQRDSIVVYRAQFIRDTTHEVQTLTVEVPVVKTEYVEKELNWWQKLLIKMGWGAIAVLVVTIIMFVKRLWLQRRLP